MEEAAEARNCRILHMPMEWIITERNLYTGVPGVKHTTSVGASLGDAESKTSYTHAVRFF